MAEPLVKTGRGGSGNYWSREDLEVAAKAGQDEDIEAQNGEPFLLARTNTSHLTLTDYSKIGRGGAGNVVFTPEASASTFELERVNTARAVNNAAGSAKKGPEVYQGYGGRGGAGNWSGNFEEKRMRNEEEERVKREVKRRVNEEVEMSLKPPRAAYCGPGS